MLITLDVSLPTLVCTRLCTSSGSESDSSTSICSWGKLDDVVLPMDIVLVVEVAIIVLVVVIVGAEAAIFSSFLFTQIVIQTVENRVRLKPALELILKSRTITKSFT